MLRCLLLSAFVFLTALAHAAEPTESRTWTAKGGKTVEGQILRVDDGKVVLKRANGRTVKVDLDVFVDADKKLIEEHFKLGEAAVPSGSGAEPADNLPHAQGEVVGPIVAGDGATYFLYLPKTLVKDRKAPLLFYTNSGGGNKALLNTIAKGAELCGWVMAISIESKNQSPVPQNKAASRACVEHILETLPVDEDRLYFTGNSGGGAMSMYNSEQLKAAGAMPNVGYIPQDCKPPKRAHYFAIGGGKDYNRYHTAHIGKLFRKNAVHRMHPGGHSGAPAWLMIDGMFWLNCRYLADNKKKHQDEMADFEARVLIWLQQKNNAEQAQRAYSNARILKDEYQIDGDHAKILNGVIEELGKERNNVLYHEALGEIDELSEKKLAPYGTGGSMGNHQADDVTRAAKKLLERYSGVPIIEKTLEAIAGPTVKI